MLPRRSISQLRYGVLLVAAISALVGCSSERSNGSAEESFSLQQEDDVEAAAQVLESMHEAAQAGDWDSYVEQFYGEQHKFASPDERDQVVARFQDEWGEQVLPVLDEAVLVRPRIVGDRALFEQDGELIFILYKDDDGRWTFHL